MSLDIGKIALNLFNRKRSPALMRGLGLPVPFVGDDEVGSSKDDLPQILPLDTGAMRSANLFNSMKPMNSSVSPQTNNFPVDNKGLPVIGAPELNDRAGAARNGVTASDDRLPPILPVERLPVGIDSSKLFSRKPELPPIVPLNNDDERLPISNLPKGADALSMLSSQEMPARSLRTQELPQNTAQPDPRQDWLDAEKNLYEADNKDYSIRKDPNTGEVIRGKDRDKKWTFWDKVGSSLLGALTGFGQGGLVGALGGGIKAGMDRNYMEKLQNQMAELPKAQRQADQARKAYETSLKLNGAENDETRAWRDDWRKSQKGLEDTHKAFLESLLQDDVFDENDAKAYFEMTGQKIAPFDKRKYEKDMRNGDTFERPNVGGGQWKPSNLPTDVIKKPVGVTQTNPDGKGFTTPMLPKDAANFQYRAGKDAATAQAQLDREDRREVIETGKINFKSEADWRNQTNKARNTFNAAQKAVQGLNVSIAEVEQQIKQYSGTVDPATGNLVGGYDTSDLQKRLDGLKEKQRKYQEDSDKASAVMNEPKPKSFSLPKRQQNNSRRSVNVSRDPMGLFR